MINLDLRDKDCSNALLELENELKNNSTGEKIVCVVSSETTKSTIENMLMTEGYTFKITSNKNDFYIEIIKNIKSSDEFNKNYVIVFDKNYMGEGDKELGEALMKSFVYTLSEMSNLPSHILLYNEGVKLVSEGSEMLDRFVLLSDKGVNILSCGSCVKYFELVEKIKVGRISNMFEIITTQTLADKIIKP
ncbi:sulfurtransferase-like selenium metabolism protein YedF [Mycoplasmatota bacterium WC44]